MTYPALPFFRSADPEHSWINAVGTLLDAANLRLSAITVPGGGNADAWMYLTAATRVVRDIADHFQIAIEHNGELELTQAEFSAALDELESAGLPLTDDRELVWDRFAARRALYEPAIRGLAERIDAAPAPWSSDGALPERVPPPLQPRQPRTD
jgi:hypothetical protein